MFAFHHISRGLNTSRLTFASFVIGSFLVVVSAWGQPRAVKDGEIIKPAPEIAPQICKATAIKKDGKVVIHITGPELLIRRKDPVDKDSKDWVVAWTKRDSLVLGKQIRAYKPSGKKLDEAAVLKALAKLVAVACFQRMHKDAPEMPDPFYRGVFRDDIVILVYEAKYWLR